MLYCYKGLMRGVNQNFKLRQKHFSDNSNTLRYKVKQSDQILQHIGQIKETVSPYLSNTKLSDGQREKWFQYLPQDNQIVNNNQQNNHTSSISQGDNRSDNYRNSLERRLEKLFREEKEMLKQRYNKSSHNNNLYDQREKSIGYFKHDEPKQLKFSCNIDKMERKIRELEERYKIQQKKKEIVEKSKPKQAKIVEVEQIHDSSKKQSRKKIRSQYVNSSEKQLLTQSVQQCVLKEKILEQEVYLLKKSIKEIKQTNDHLLKKQIYKQQKRKQKHRTKQLLHQILLKLQFINVEIGFIKKKQKKQNMNKLNNMVKYSDDLLQEFQLLKIQYKHLEQERRKVQKKQSELQNRIKVTIAHQETKND